MCTRSGNASCIELPMSLDIKLVKMSNNMYSILVKGIDCKANIIPKSIYELPNKGFVILIFVLNPN